jgi:hypothetical protein
MAVAWLWPKAANSSLSPKEQILARFAAQTNRQSRRRPIRPRGL